MEADTVWQTFLSKIKPEITQAAYKTWFLPAKITTATFSDGKAYIKISTNNSFSKNQLSKKYGQLIKGRLEGILGKRVELFFDVKSSLENNFQLTGPLFERTKKSAPAGLNPNFTFDNFVVGQSNNLATAAAKAVSGQPGNLYNPLFIWGPTGVGKTHLLQAVGNGIFDQGEAGKIIYTTCEKFTNEFIDSLKEKKIKSFRDKYRRIDVFLIDDVQFLSGREATQEEFFHTFNDLYAVGKQLVITAECHPAEIGKLANRLVSRFLGGLAVDIKMPDFVTRLEILKSKAKKFGLSLDNQVLGFIAKNQHSNPRELEGVLTKIATLNGAGGRFSFDLVKNLLTKNQPRSVNPQLVISAVCRHFQLKKSELVGGGRKKDLVIPRQIIMYLLKSEFGLALSEIGRILGNRDHSTVVYGVEKIRDNLRNDGGLRSTVELLKRGFG